MSDFENGIMMGFENNQLIIGLIDDCLVEEEKLALKRNTCMLYYLSKGPVDLFLINIDDSLETSDVPFCVHDWKDDEDFIKMLNDSSNLQVKVVYMDKKGNELVSKNGTLDTKMSQCIRDSFKNNLEKEFDELAYDSALARIIQRYEPFEMEEQALCKCKL